MPRSTRRSASVAPSAVSVQAEEEEEDGPMTTGPNVAEEFFTPDKQEDYVKILIATDNHLGFNEKDPVRGQDSFNTFDEILSIAHERDVDFVLLGGDLFHENKPSRDTLHRAMSILRKHVLGDRPVSVELNSDPMADAVYGQSFPAVNYEDFNLNVAMPVFSIHGNHDDPQGTGAGGALSALDILSVAGLVNYFGKVELPSSDEAATAKSKRAADKGGLSEPGIRVRPVLLSKGSTRIGMYGMGNIKDERLHFELRASRVRMYRPREDPDSFFNILVVHQNRIAHNPKSYVPETMFDDSINLVIWGHEHGMEIDPTTVTDKSYRISQPGSSVATSLCQAESGQKCVGILHLEGMKYAMEPIPLKTVRPFVMEDITLADAAKEADVDLTDRRAVSKLLKSEINGLIAKADEQWLEQYKDVDEQDRPPRMLPLVRLRVQYTAAEIENPIRIGQDFQDKVANPRDIVQFYKKPVSKKNAPQDLNIAPFEKFQDDMLPSLDRLEHIEVVDLVREHAQQQVPSIFPGDSLATAVQTFVDKDNTSAIRGFVENYIKRNYKQIIQAGTDRTTIEDGLSRVAAIARGDEGEDGERGNAGGSASPERPPAKGAAKGKEKAPARARGKATSTSRARGRARDSDEEELDDEDVQMDLDDGDDDEDSTPPPPKATKKRAPSAAAAKGKNATPAAASSSRSKKNEALFRQDEDDDVDEAIIEEDEDDEIIAIPTGRAAGLGLNAAAAKKKKAPAAAPKKAAAARGRVPSTGGSVPTSSNVRISQLSFDDTTGGAGTTAGRAPRRAAATKSARVTRETMADGEDRETWHVSDDSD